MIYAVVSNKGGVGKSTISFHALTAILSNFRLLEIDDSNNTSSVFDQSKTLENKVKSVKLSDGADAFSNALFEQMSTKADIIIDAGGGSDSKAVIEMIVNETGEKEVVFIVPLMSGRAQTQNALATYQMLQGRPVAFALNAASSTDQFIFWHGSENYGLTGVDKKLQKLPSAFIPQTHLFDLAATTGETILDLADQFASFTTPAEAREGIFELANGDQAEFVRLMARFRISTACKNYIQNDLAALRKIIIGE